MCWVNQPAVPMWHEFCSRSPLTRRGVYDSLSRAGSSAADVPVGLAAFMADAQVPWSVGALGGAATDPAWRAKPSWYLVATEDRMIPPPAQPAPFSDYQHKRQAIARPGKSASRTRTHSIRHHPASVRTQISHFGRGATGHGSDQDAAHSGGDARSDHHRQSDTRLQPGDRIWSLTACSPNGAAVPGSAADAQTDLPAPSGPHVRRWVSPGRELGRRLMQDHWRASTDLDHRCTD